MNGREVNGATPAQWLPRAALTWLLLAEAALLLPHLARLPLWLPVLFGLALGYRWQVQRVGWRLPPQWLKLVGVASGFIATGLSYGTLLGLEATTALLFIAAALKLLEAHTRRDAYLLIFLGYFCVLLAFLFEQTPLTAFYALLPLLLLTAALLAMHAAGEGGGATLRRAALLLIQSLPIMVLLFLVAPRLAPLWSVPQPSDAARTGMGAEVAPGDVARLSRSDRLAMRVRFAEGVPPRPELYWRGVVLSHFDGRSWLPWPDHNRSLEATERRALRRRASDDTWSYRVLLEPSHRRWRFSLGYPLAADGSVEITGDYRLVGDAAHERQLYRAESVPALPLHRDLQRVERARLLALPSSVNPSARDWGRELAAAHAPAERVRRVLQRFRDEPFVYTLQPPTLGRDSVDEFLFQTRRGFCEHYASAFAFVMRAADVPARVVVGYQGGEVNPLTGSVLVHDYDAHAWVEVWLSGRGWVRVDPTAAVAPSRIELGLEGALADEFLSDSPLAPARYREIDWLNRLRLQLDAFQDQWAIWVLNYHGERQWQVLRGLLGEVSVWRVAGLLLIGAALPLALLALVLWRGQRRRRDPLLRRYQSLCARLSAAGHPPEPGEPPAAYLLRVAEARPDWGIALRPIAHLFNDLRYRRLTETQRSELRRHLYRALRRFRWHRG